MTTKDALLAWNDAVKLAEAKKYPEAVQKFSEIKDNVHALPSRMHFNIGTVQLILCEYDAALESLNESIRRDSLSAASYFRRGTIFYAKESYLNAYKEFVVCAEYLRNGLVDYTQLGLKCKLFKCEALYNAGISMLKARNPDQAVEAFTSAQSAQNDTPEIKALTKKLDVDSALDKAKQTGAEAAALTLVDPMKERFFAPPLAKVKNLASKDYLGKATVVSSVTDKDTFSGFEGPRKLEPVAKTSEPPVAKPAAKPVAPSAEPKLPPASSTAATAAAAAAAAAAATAFSTAATAAATADSRPPPPLEPPARLPPKTAEVSQAASSSSNSKPKLPPPQLQPPGAVAAKPPAADSQADEAVALRAVAARAAMPEKAPPLRPAPALLRSAAVIVAGPPVTSRPVPQLPDAVGKEEPAIPAAAASSAPALPSRSVAAAVQADPATAYSLPPRRPAAAAAAGQALSPKPIPRQLLPGKSASQSAAAPASAASGTASNIESQRSKRSPFSDPVDLSWPDSDSDVPMRRLGAVAKAPVSGATAADQQHPAGPSQARGGGSSPSKLVDRLKLFETVAAGSDSVEGKPTSAQNCFVNLELVIGEETEALCVKMETLDQLHSRIGEKLSSPADSFSLWYADQSGSKVKVDSDDTLLQLWALCAPTGKGRLWCYARW